MHKIAVLYHYITQNEKTTPVVNGCFINNRIGTN